MRAEDLRDIIMSGHYDNMKVKELASLIRGLEASTDEILNKIKEKDNETVKYD